jgi:endonuclease/exonuclease/phosphatase family metal-dependent hydrolase
METKTLSLPQSLYAALRRQARSRHQTGSGAGCTTVASYNVHKCVGIDGEFDPTRTAAVIAELDADVLALQEVDERHGTKAGLLDLDALARNTGLVAVHAPPNSRSHGWHGNLLLARIGIIESVKAIRLPGLEPRGALLVDMRLRGVPLRVIAAHFGLLRRSRSQQASALVKATKEVEYPTLLLGDLNEWRVKTRSSLHALLPHFGPIGATIPSFPSRYPLLALDRILARPANLLSSIEVHQSPLARLASDHLPLKASLNLSLLTSTLNQAA